MSFTRTDLQPFPRENGAYQGVLCGDRFGWLGGACAGPGGHPVSPSAPVPHQELR